MSKPHVPIVIPAGEKLEERRFFKIPVPILEIVREENLFAPFRFFMYCKTVSTSGQMTFCRKTIALAAADLKVSQKTIKRHLAILHKRNWIGRFKSGGYILRSFDKLRRIEKRPGRSAVWFDAKKHLKPFREFVVSVGMGHLIARQKSRLWKGQRLSGNRSGIPNERKRSFPTFFPLACEALHILFGISIGTSFNWKRDAHAAGFITIKPILRPVMAEWVLENPVFEHRLVVRNGHCYIQYPDKVQCNLQFTRRRALKKLDKK